MKKMKLIEKIADLNNLKGCGIIHLDNTFSGFWFQSHIYEHYNIYFYLSTTRKLMSLSEVLQLTASNIQLYRFLNDKLNDEIRLFILNATLSPEQGHLEAFLENLITTSSPTFQDYLREKSSIYREGECTISESPQPDLTLDTTKELIDNILNHLGKNHPIKYNSDMIKLCEREIFSDVIELERKDQVWVIKDD